MFLLCMLETIVSDLFSLVCFPFQPHLGVNPNNVRAVLVSVISNTILVGRYSYFFIILLEVMRVLAPIDTHFI